jgi:hypothetical protein
MTANRLPVCNDRGMSDSRGIKREPHRYTRRAVRARTAGDVRHRRQTRVNRRIAAAAESSGGVAPRRPLRLGLLVFVQYALLAVDMRFVASAHYVGIAVANLCIATTTWYLTKEIVTARTFTDRVCFAAGGTAGALLAVYVT